MMCVFGFDLIVILSMCICMWDMLYVGGLWFWLCADMLLVDNLMCVC